MLHEVKEKMMQHRGTKCLPG